LEKKYWEKPKFLRNHSPAKSGVEMNMNRQTDLKRFGVGFRSFSYST
jgi:hypothetical protein